jgi:hypothetical protein
MCINIDKILNMTSILSQDEVADLDEKIHSLYESSTSTNDLDDPHTKKK